MERTETGKAKLNTGTALWLWKICCGQKRYILAAIVIQMVVSVFVVEYSLLFRDLIDCAGAGDRSGFFRVAAGLAAMAAGQLSLRALGRFLDEWIRSGLENTAKRRLLRTLLYQDYAAVTATHSGEWMNRLTSDSVVVADGLTQIVPNVVGMVVRMIGAFVVITCLAPWFGVTLVPAGLAVVLVSWLFRPLLKRTHKQIQESDGAVRVLLQERLEHLLIVRAFARQNRTLELAEDAMKAHRSSRMRRNHFTNGFNVAFGTAMQGMYLLGAVWCGWGILNGTISFGTMTAVLQLISQLQTPLSNLSGYLPRWYAMLASAERLMEAERFSRTTPEELPSEQEVRSYYEKTFDGICVDGLCFTYERKAAAGEAETDPVTLKNVHLELGKGEFVALVGHSGCGKSTLLKLLMCLYTPEAGEIRLREHPGGTTRPLTGADCGLFAYVPQGNQLMSGTIRQSVAFYEEDKMKQEDRIRQALRIACAEEFVDRLPDGLDTLLGERGCGLSEGQLQRLAIARAILSGRPVLLLDEATSSLDEETERRVLDNLRGMTDNTVLIVTHRPRACEICDRVVQLRSSGD